MELINGMVPKFEIDDRVRVIDGGKTGTVSDMTTCADYYLYMIEMDEEKEEENNLEDMSGREKEFNKKPFEPVMFLKEEEIEHI